MHITCCAGPASRGFARAAVADVAQAPSVPAQGSFASALTGSPRGLRVGRRCRGADACRCDVRVMMTAARTAWRREVGVPFAVRADGGVGRRFRRSGTRQGVLRSGAVLGANQGFQHPHLEFAAADSDGEHEGCLGLEGVRVTCAAETRRLCRPAFERRLNASAEPADRAQSVERPAGLAARGLDSPGVRSGRRQTGDERIQP